MKKKEALLALSALVLSSCFLAGCSDSPSDDAGQADTQLIAQQDNTQDSASEPAETSLAEEEEEEEETADVVELETGDIVDLGPLLDEGVPLADAPVINGVLTPTAPGTSVKENSSVTIDYSNAADGYVMIKWTDDSGAKLKIQIKGPGGTTYQYNLRADGAYEVFPFSDSSGSYTIAVYKNISGNKYSTVLTATVSVSLSDEFGPFLRPNQYVNFSGDSAAVAKAAELCAGLSGNLDKVSAIYNFVVNNTTYDKAKADSVQSGYLPDVDEILRTGKGICFDYAALMAAMLRSQGVPVKLIVGYTGDVYHAWINVWSETEGWIEAKIYFDGTSWKLMDPTFASSDGGSDKIMQYIGNGENYTAKYQY